MSKRIVWNRPDGTVAVTVLVEEATDERVHAEALRLQQQQADLGTPVAEIEPTEIPTDREFRDAWEWSASRINVGLTRAKAIQTARIEQQLLDERLEIDKELAMASLRNDNAEQARLNAERNAQAARLQEALVAVNSATTVAQLKAARPARR